MGFLSNSSSWQNQHDLNPHVKKFLQAISSKPDLQKFGYTMDQNKTYQKALSSPIFGQSVLLPVGSKSSKRNKENNLENNIIMISKNIDVMCGGGYYTLNNIRESPSSQFCLDIHLLINNVQDNLIFKQLYILNEFSQQSMNNTSFKSSSISLNKSINQQIFKHASKIQTKLKQKMIYYDDISQAINGFARIIKYKNHSIEIDQAEIFDDKCITNNPKDLQLIEIQEGQYFNGKKQGYCRVISAQDGSCELGFWKNNQPWGKYCKYDLNGNYILDEGFYKGPGQNGCTTKMEISNYKNQIQKIQ